MPTDSWYAIRNLESSRLLRWSNPRFELSETDTCVLLMKTTAKIFALVVLLNLVRYFVGGPIEAATIMEPMHSVMPEYPEVFDNDFSSTDFMISLAYNFALWFFATLACHLMMPSLPGPIWVRSLTGFALMAAFFCSLAAVYMNHYTDVFRPFYAWSMIDALIVFSLVGLANGLLYPLLFREEAKCLRTLAET